MNETTKTLLSFGIVVVLFSALGCSKSSELGLSLVEQEQTDIEYTDSMPVYLTTVSADKSVIRSQASPRSQMVVGAYTDPIFGESSAAAHLNFRLTRTNATFPNCVFDSLVLSLAYEFYGHYGDVNGFSPTTQSWDVVRLAEPILEQDYYSDAFFATSTPLKTGYMFVPNTDSSYAGTDSAAVLPIRIRLDDAAGMALGQEFLSPSDTTVYESNIDFKNWFNGVKVMPSSGGMNSSLLRLRFKDANTKLTLYYTDTSNGGAVANTFEFLTDEDAEVVTSFEHDYAGTAVLDTINADTTVYLQGMDGVLTRIEFPNLQNLGEVIINKAELVVEVQDTGSTAYPEPIQLVAQRRDAANELVLVDDVATSIVRLQSYLLFGGALEKDNLSVNRYLYRFQLAEQLQTFVDDSSVEKAIYLTTPSPLDPERIKLVNHESDYAKAKLYLTYTKLNN